MERLVMVCCVCSITIITSCAVNLPFNNRLAYSHVSEAKKLNTNKTKPLTLEWKPTNFVDRVDIQGASGYVGSGTATRIPTGIGLSSRITEALDVSVGISATSKNVLEMYIISSQTDFEYSAGMFNITPGIDYGKCTLNVIFNYNGSTWKEHFVSEEKDPEYGGTSQTGIVEKVWDNIALQVAKNVVSKIEQLPLTENYKDSEQYRNKINNEDETVEKARKLLDQYRGDRFSATNAYRMELAKMFPGFTKNSELPEHSEARMKYEHFKSIISDLATER